MEDYPHLIRCLDRSSGRHGKYHVPPRCVVQVSEKRSAETRDRTGDLWIFSLTLSHLSYFGT